jgi:hypothetical protein
MKWPQNQLHNNDVTRPTAQGQVSEHPASVGFRCHVASTALSVPAADVAAAATKSQAGASCALPTVLSQVSRKGKYPGKGRKTQVHALRFHCCRKEGSEATSVQCWQCLHGWLPNSTCAWQPNNLTRRQQNKSHSKST